MANGQNSQDEDLQSLFMYLKTAEQTLRDASEQAPLLVESILEEIQGKELAVAMHQRCSRLLDRAIPLLPMDAFTKVTKSFLQSEVFAEAAAQQYASHVLQSLIASCAQRLFSQGEDGAHDGGDESQRATLVGIIVESIDGILDESVLCKLLQDACGSHVFRWYILLLSGRVPQKEERKKDDVLPERCDEVHQDLGACLNKLVDATTAILHGKHRRPVILSTGGSACVQLFLKVLHANNIKSGRVLLYSILCLKDKTEPLSIDEIDFLANSPAASRLLEVVVTLSPASLKAKLFSEYFQPRGFPGLCPPASNSASPSSITAKSCKLSFVFAVDGKCEKNRFKPSRDESQWWGRTDAVVRSISAAMWQTANTAYQNCGEAVLVFDGDGAVVRHTSPICAEVQPTEQNLVRCWKGLVSGKKVAGGRLERPDENLAVDNWSEYTYKKLLTKLIHGKKKAKDSASKTAIVLLHEDYPELPMLNEKLANIANKGIDHIIFCLGTVRDMKPEETNAIVKAAQELKVGALLGVAVGRRAEFTSKVVHAVHAHNVHGRLLPAVELLASQQKQLALVKLSQEEKDSRPAPAKPLHLHLVATMPFALVDISSDVSPDVRAKMRPLVSTVVCALHRSHGASRQDHSDPSPTRLSLVFECGNVIALNQQFVTAMAENHQAAPSEFQILSALGDSIAASEAGDEQDDGVTLHNNSSPSTAWEKVLAQGKSQMLLDLRANPSSFGDLSSVVYQHADHLAEFKGNGGLLVILDNGACELLRDVPKDLVPVKIAIANVRLSLGAQAALLQQFHSTGHLIPALRTIRAAPAGSIASASLPPPPKFLPLVSQAMIKTLSPSELTLAAAALPLDGLVKMGNEPSRRILLSLVERVCSCEDDNKVAMQDAIAKAIFKSLNVMKKSEHWQSWPCIMTMYPAAADYQYEANWWEAHNLSSAGCQMLSGLLQFGKSSLTPLIEGAASLLDERVDCGASRSFWIALCTDRRFSRVLESVFSPASPLPMNFRSKLARRIINLENNGFQDLALHQIGSWVVVAMWKGTLGQPDLRKQMAEQLLQREEEVRAQSWAVWKHCGLAQYKTANKSWSESQKKQSRAADLFQGFFTDDAPKAKRRKVELEADTSRQANQEIDDLFKISGSGQAAKKNTKVNHRQEPDRSNPVFHGNVQSSAKPYKKKPTQQKKKTNEELANLVKSSTATKKQKKTKGERKAAQAQALRKGDKRALAQSKKKKFMM